MLKTSSLLLILLLPACASPDVIRMYDFDRSNCDPAERANCVSIKGEMISAINEMADENERMRAALEFCQKKL